MQSKSALSIFSIQVADNRSRGLLKLYPRVLEALKRTLLPFRQKLPAGTYEVFAQITLLSKTKVESLAYLLYLDT
ncbi:hypothetical protein QYF36_017589 [Acer negundo]|nr:hypothetical protein QYF36_017589 [Acer negundo]